MNLFQYELIFLLFDGLFNIACGLGRRVIAAYPIYY
jgi:hypothetical protein